MVYRTQAVTTRKIETVSEEETERRLESIFHEATFVNRGKKRSTVEVRFAAQEEAISQSTTILRTEKVTLLPAYGGRHNVQAHIGRVRPEIKVEWLVATVMAASEEDAKNNFS